MTALSSSSDHEDVLLSSCILLNNHVDGRHALACPHVGTVLLDANAGTKVPPEVSDDIDRHIADMAAKAVQARHDGDAHGAALYIRRMVKAIRLQIDAARHLDEGLDYFQAQGEAARLAQEGRVA